MQHHRGAAINRADAIKRRVQDNPVALTKAKLHETFSQFVRRDFSWFSRAFVCCGH
jgi:hypothetical protein